MMAIKMYMEQRHIKIWHISIVRDADFCEDFDWQDYHT